MGLPSAQGDQAEDTITLLLYVNNYFMRLTCCTLMSWEIQHGAADHPIRQVRPPLPAMTFSGTHAAWTMAWDSQHKAAVHPGG